MFLAPVIDDVLESKKSKLIGEWGYPQVVSTLNRAFKNVEPFKFHHETYYDYGRNDYSVSGLYSMDTDIKHIVLNFSKRCTAFEISPRSWSQFKFDVSQVCQHETIHQTQWQHRDSSLMGQFDTTVDFRNTMGSVEDEKQYLADADEIDAYAHDIAMEIKFKYPKRHPYEILKPIDTKRNLWSYTYYKRTFRGEDWSHIKKRLLKKTFLWLPYIH